jgi:hypothetical protein
MIGASCGNSCSNWVQNTLHYFLLPVIAATALLLPLICCHSSAAPMLLVKIQLRCCTAAPACTPAHSRTAAAEH